MRKLISIIPLLILALIFCFACTTIGQEAKAVESKPDIAAAEQNSDVEIEQLIEDLKDKDSKVRKDAAEDLGNIGDSLAVDPLIEALRDENSFVRQNAAKALGQIKDVKAVEPLIEALGDKDNDVRKYAAAALGYIGDTKAIKPLIEALKVVDFYDEDAREAAMNALVSIGEPAVEPLIEALGDKEIKTGTRCYAAEALGNIGDNRALKPLIEALGDEETFIKFYAAEALGNIGDNRAVEPLIEALKDEDENVRKAAAYALGEIGDNRALEPLIEALGDEKDIVRKNAAYALGQIGKPAIESLFKALEDKNGYVRINAARALGNINDPNVIEFLIASLKDKKLEIIAGAYSFFIKRGEEGTEAVLIEALNAYGDEGMATSYINCGNIELSKAARTWATSHGYNIIELPIGGGDKSWGSNK